mmetsp:Transcript_3763/g.17291  ORF Transcript_3763/g.17291 Transcript_3763/m.17291 type:complete len:219 (-) Transcript_3763:3306-3962(-)
MATSHVIVIVIVIIPGFSPPNQPRPSPATVPPSPSAPPRTRSRCPSWTCPRSGRSPRRRPQHVLVERIPRPSGPTKFAPRRPRRSRRPNTSRRRAWSTRRSVRIDRISDRPTRRRRAVAAGCSRSGLHRRGRRGCDRSGFGRIAPPCPTPASCPRWRLESRYGGWSRLGAGRHRCPATHGSSDGNRAVRRLSRPCRSSDSAASRTSEARPFASPRVRG